jgi:AcrR family transcriptional regulator
VDGRSERWRQHRIDRRAEFVEAALRALGKHGPDVGIADIAAEAGVAKPKLYRHFDDKADLMRAVTDRISMTVWQRLTAALDPRDAPARLVRHGLDAFLGVVDEYPNAFRLLLRSGPQAGGQTSDRVLEDGRRLAEVLSALIAGQLRIIDVDTEAAQPAAHALAGAVGATTLWWLEHRSISKEALIGHLTTIILGALDAVLRGAGVVIDLDEPIGSRNVRTMA